MKPIIRIFASIAAIAIIVCGCNKSASSNSGQQPGGTASSANQTNDFLLVAVVKAEFTDHVRGLLNNAGIEARVEQAGESAISKSSFQPPPGSWCVKVVPTAKSKATQILYKDFHDYYSKGVYLWAMPPF
ncbi:MAG: hypothetical protein WCS94_25105 [Verrucomicrobiota bacterium]